jgi:hypothetical protein
MRKIILVFVMFLMAHRLMAQVGNVGINTSTPSAMLHVKDSSVLFSGATTLPGTPGNPPVSGAGIRMMWYPDKAAFRAGRVSSTQWDKDSIGNYSFATGYNAKAKGLYSVALGNSTIATGNFSAAIGSAAIASGEIAAAIGESVTASGQSSMALGANSVASGLGSAAIGSGASATNSFSIALGGSTASGNRSVALGDNTLSSGSSSTAMGSFTAATGNFSTAMGEGTTASGNRSTAMGEGTIASGSRSTAIGFFTAATGNHSTAMGLYTTSRPYASFVVGRYNDSINTSNTGSWVETDPVFIIGNGTADNARNNALVVLKNARTGINTGTPVAMLHVKDSAVLFSGAATIPATPGNPPISGQGIRMMWYPDKAAFRTGYVSATNWNKDSIGNYSFATGFDVKAKGNSSTAMGGLTNASGNNSTSLGLQTTAFGDYSTAVGFQTTAFGDNSTAMGYLTTALGNYSTTMGYNTNATGIYSTAMGNNTTASANSSTAMGNNTIASGNVSTAMGLYNTSKAYASFTVGRFNDSISTSSTDTWVDTDPVFIIGNGTADNARKNALVVLKNARTGINTSTPAAILHVEGNAKLGIKGTVIDELIKVTRNKNVPNVPANSTITETFGVSDAQPGSTVYISPADALDDGLLIAYARVSVAGTVEVKFTNTTGLAINPAAMDFYITVIR